MNKMQELADILNNREYYNEVERHHEAFARVHNLVICFGYSDDCIEFRGKIYDEIGVGDFYITEKKELFDVDFDKFDNAEEQIAFIKKYTSNLKLYKISSDFSENGFKFSTDLPHAKFHILEDGEVYGEGIVIDLNGIGT